MARRNEAEVEVEVEVEMGVKNVSGRTPESERGSRSRAEVVGVERRGCEWQAAIVAGQAIERMISDPRPRLVSGLGRVR
jgi:hypothetical protein